jgi:hypothetical protein
MALPPSLIRAAGIVEAVTRSAVSGVCSVTFGAANSAIAIIRRVASFLPQPGEVARGVIRSRRGAAAVGILCLFGIPSLVLAFFLIAALSNPFLKQELGYAEERSSAVEVYDAKGRWLGILPPADFADWSDGSYLPPDHAAAVPRSIPPVWKNCVVALEDHNFDGVSRWLGIDPFAIVKSGFFTLIGDRRRGASTLYMQVVRELEGRSPSADEAPGEIAFRKLAEIFGANALVKMIASDDRQAAARLVAMHTPLVIGTSGSRFGDPIYGIELTSQILYGRSVETLSLDEQAVLAAAIKVPILLAPPNNASAQARALARWIRVKERADFCLRSVLPKGAPELADARQRLHLQGLPGPVVDPDLFRLLPQDKEAAWNIAVNPVRRAQLFGDVQLQIVRTELNSMFPNQRWRGNVVSVRLSISADDNNDFVHSVRARLQNAQTSMSGLSMPLSSNNPADRAANAISVLASADGHITLFYSSRSDLLWHWRTQMASTAKMVAAIALGRYDHPWSQYCHASINEDAGTGRRGLCATPNSWVSAQDAFARSDNEAIRWRLRQLPVKELRDVATAFLLPSFGTTPPATALTRGTIDLVPAQALQIVTAIGAGLSHRDQDIYLPTIIDQLVVLGPNGRLGVVTPRYGTPILAPTLHEAFTPPVTKFVEAVLAGTSDANGTLRSLSDVKASLGGRLYAKTGTESVLHKTYSVHIIGTFDANRSWQSFLVTIGSPDKRAPIGYGLNAGSFSGLARLGIVDAIGLRHVETHEVN